jgi:signal transduction histidine kinase
MNSPRLTSDEIISAGSGRVVWLRPLIYAGCAAAFYADVNDDVSLAFGLFYVPLICTAIFHRNPNSAWWLALLSTALITTGFFLPNINANMAQAVTNRILSIVVIVITAVLVRHMRSIQDRLMDQTRRAEAAERVKTMVFTNLSQEIRGPLHSMIGLTGLMQADCRQDQRPSLVEIHNSARRLLATIENLIDLTQFNERELRTETVDVARLVLQAADSARSSASERQISVDVAVPPEQPLVTQGNSWAIRRILDNLVANAIKFSPPGATVVVATEVTPGSVAALVHDEGFGMTSDVVRHLGDPFFQVGLQEAGTAGTGTGLALSRRLASSIGAELTFNSEPGVGTTAVLRMRR